MGMTLKTPIGSMQTDDFAHQREASRLPILHAIDLTRWRATVFQS